MSTDPSLPKDQSKYLSKLEGKRVLVLGGTSGIGFCIAEAAVEHNGQVIVSSSSPEKVAKTLDRLRTAYPSRSANIRGKTCNLSDPATLEAELGELFKFAGKGIAHVAFTAGGPVSLKPISEVSVEYLQNPNTEFVEPLKEREIKQSLGGAIGRPEDVAEAYLYLMKDQFITGTMISSNGGRLLV